MKLRWAHLSGGSAKQVGDARGIYELQSALLNRDYLDRWARVLGVTDAWDRLQQEARPLDE